MHQPVQLVPSVVELTVDQGTALRDEPYMGAGGLARARASTALGQPPTNATDTATRTDMPGDRPQTVTIAPNARFGERLGPPVRSKQRQRPSSP